jgi:hypothetical protein
MLYVAPFNIAHLQFKLSVDNQRVLYSALRENPCHACVKVVYGGKRGGERLLDVAALFAASERGRFA